jgi:hypothetical protein
MAFYKTDSSPVFIIPLKSEEVLGFDSVENHRPSTFLTVNFLSSIATTKEEVHPIGLALDFSHS